MNAGGVASSTSQALAAVVLGLVRLTWRDRNNVSRGLRKVRAGTSFDWFVSHTARRTVATLLDGQDLSARAIADQLGHARVSMTQDVYMGRRIVGQEAARSLDGLVPMEGPQR